MLTRGRWEPWLLAFGGANGPGSDLALASSIEHGDARSMCSGMSLGSGRFSLGITRIHSGRMLRRLGKSCARGTTGTRALTPDPLF